MGLYISIKCSKSLEYEIPTCIFNSFRMRKKPLMSEQATQPSLQPLSFIHTLEICGWDATDDDDDLISSTLAFIAKK